VLKLLRSAQCELAMKQRFDFVRLGIQRSADTLAL
jgi:hypothetical protein